MSLSMSMLPDWIVYSGFLAYIETLNVITHGVFYENEGVLEHSLFVKCRKDGPKIFFCLCLNDAKRYQPLSRTVLD